MSSLIKTLPCASTYFEYRPINSLFTSSNTKGELFIQCDNTYIVRIMTIITIITIMTIVIIILKKLY